MRGADSRYSTTRPFALALLQTHTFHAYGSDDTMLQAIEVIRTRDQAPTRRPIPREAPMRFVTEAWRPSQQLHHNVRRKDVGPQTTATTAWSFPETAIVPQTFSVLLLKRVGRRSRRACRPRQPVHAQRWNRLGPKRSRPCLPRMPGDGFPMPALVGGPTANRCQWGRMQYIRHGKALRSHAHRARRDLGAGRCTSHRCIEL
jgi:hypothetical protein